MPKPKYQLQAKNETGDKTIDIQSFIVPDSSITAGSGIVNIATATGDVTGPASATDNAATVFDSTTGKVVKDGSAVNVLLKRAAESFTTTATAAGTTTLTVASNPIQEFTGVTTQTVVLPVVSTLPKLGFRFTIINNSTGALTVNSSGSNLVQTVGVGATVVVVAVLLTGTTAASWGRSYFAGATTAGYFSMSPVFRIEAGANDYLQGSSSIGSNFFAATLDHTFLVGAALDAAKFDASVTAGSTRMLIYDVDNATLERVTVGAADSGGAGYKLLRIPN